METPPGHFTTAELHPITSAELKSSFGESSATLEDLSSLPHLRLRSNLSPIYKGFRDDAAALGKEYLGRVLNYYKLSANKVHVFAYQVVLLRDVFRAVTHVPLKGYSLDKERMIKLKRALLQVREKTFLTFYSTGSMIPPLPTWGRDDQTSEVWSTNDFMILACSFVDEVESFLGAFYKAYSLVADDPLPEISRSSDLISEEPKGKGKEQLLTENEAVDASSTSTVHPTFVRQLPPHQSRVEEYTGILRHEDSSNVTMRRKRPSLKFPDFTQGLADLSIQPEFVIETRKETARSSLPSIPKKPFLVERKRDKTHSPHGDPGDSSDPDSSDNGKPSREPDKTPKKDPPSAGKGKKDDPKANSSETLFLTFDHKLKVADLPEWNGNPDTLAKWIKRITQISEGSPAVYRQLGKLVPQRLTSSAETWYWSLTADRRKATEENWGTLRDAIKGYYMNRSWLDKQKSRANKATYRDSGNFKELPSEYYIRKLDLLTLVFQMSEPELIMEIMAGAPSSWVSILNPNLYDSLSEFQEAIKYHEENLIHLGQHFREPREDHEPKRPFFRNKGQVISRKSYLVGWSSKLEPPKFPKDDRNVSKKTPESMGARPCRHCGSSKHWDNDCKYSRKATKAARSNRVSVDDEELQAQEAYDELYYDLTSDEESDKENSNAQECYLVSQNSNTDTVVVHQGEPEHSKDQDSSTESKEGPSATSLLTGVCKEEIPKPPLNRRSRRRLARQIADVYISWPESLKPKNALIKLKKLMARPPGTTFLGSKATKAIGHIGALDQNPIDVIFDSGSDITLISHSTLQRLRNPPKLKQDQKIGLVQLTGKSSISGYVNLDLYFQTQEGPVLLNLDAFYSWK